jgi:hypothetical protein
VYSMMLWLFRAQCEVELQAKTDGTLLELEFHTVTDYLFLLKEAGLASRVAGNQVMFVLAAAVSDFFVPEELMARAGFSTLCCTLTVEGLGDGVCLGHRRSIKSSLKVALQG